MIQVAICDDESLVAHQLESIIWDTCNSAGIKVDTEVYNSGFALEKGILTGQKFDLIYLDIQMKMGMVFRLLEIFGKWMRMLLSFCIKLRQIYDGIVSFGCFAFIKKPIEQDSFSKTFLEANRKICSKNFFYAFKYRNQEYKIPCKDILYYESRGRQITIYERGGETYVFNGKLSDVEKNLEEGKIPFLRIHQSYLVNYLLIKSRTKSEVVLINGTKLKISEDKQKKFSRDYGQLLRGEINV